MYYSYRGFICTCNLDGTSSTLIVVCSVVQSYNSDFFSGLFYEYIHIHMFFWCLSVYHQFIVLDINLNPLGLNIGCAIKVGFRLSSVVVVNIGCSGGGRM